MHPLLYLYFLLKESHVLPQADFRNVSRDLYFSNNKSVNLTFMFKAWNSQQRVRRASYKNNPFHVSLTIGAS